jgi:hypothetical protein
MHQAERRAILRPAVPLGPPVLAVDRFPLGPRLVADRPAPLVPPGRAEHRARRDVGALLAAPGVLEGRGSGRRRGGPAHVLRGPGRS